MYAVSFRIPYIKFGKKQYVNGSAFFSRSLVVGTLIKVRQRDSSDPSPVTAIAEVIDSRDTQRLSDSFEWIIPWFNNDYPAVSK